MTSAAPSQQACQAGLKRKLRQTSDVSYGEREEEGALNLRAMAGASNRYVVRKRVEE
jgi:hypothetical protein